MTASRSLLRVLCTTVVALGGLVLLAPVAVFLGVRGLFGACVRALDRMIQGQLRVTAWADLFEFRAGLGRKLRPGLDVYAPSYGADLYHLQTCSLGWPSKLELVDADVIVVGDSFAACAGVDAEQAYFRPGGDAPRIKPIACSGFDMVQGLVALKQLPPAVLRDKLVVWFVCTGNDLVENGWPSVDGWPKPFLAAAPGNESLVFRTVDGHVRDASTRPFSAGLGRVRSPKSTVRSTVDLYGPGYMSDRAYAGARHVVENASAFVRAHGGRLAVLTIPYLPIFLPRNLLARVLKGVDTSALRTSYLDERFDAICLDAEVTHVSGAKVFGLFDYLFLGDDHWNERGHKKARQVIARLWSTHRGGAA